VMLQKSIMRLTLAFLMGGVWEFPVLAHAQEHLERTMTQWEKDVRKSVAGDGKLKELVNKYPLVLLHSRFLFGGDHFKRSAFSFVHKTSDDKKHGNFIQLYYESRALRISGRLGVIADLGNADFEKDPNPKKISIVHPGFTPRVQEPQKGHVYLQRIRDNIGNDFYVVYQVVVVDNPRGHYIAFIWRKLPGGQVAFPVSPEGKCQTSNSNECRFVSQQESTMQILKIWEDRVRKQILKDDKLKSLPLKYPLILLAEGTVEGTEANFDSSQFDFVNGTISGGANLTFHGGETKTLDIRGDPKCFIVDLGKQDFEQKIDPAEISIDHPGLSGSDANATEGHVYLQRVHTRRGSDFYVVFQVVAVGPDGQYIAFFWRRLPGGKIVK
jgi:hypothetical protein